MNQLANHPDEGYHGTTDTTIRLTACSDYENLNREGL